MATLERYVRKSVRPGSSACELAVRMFNFSLITFKVLFACCKEVIGSGAILLHLFHMCRLVLQTSLPVGRETAWAEV